MRRKVDLNDVGEVEWKPASSGSDEMELWHSSVLGKRVGGDVTQMEGWGVAGQLRTRSQVLQWAGAAT